MHNIQLVRRTGIATGVAASLLLGLAPVAGAGGGSVMTIDPASGPAGTTITVSSTGGCFPGSDLRVTLTPGFTGAIYAGGVDGDGTPISSADGNLTDGEMGSWTVPLPVPASAAAGPYTVDARCIYTAMEPRLTGRTQRAQNAGFNYAPVRFQVTPEEATTTTTLTATTTTVPGTTTTVAPPAARAVQARPTYAG